MGSQGRPLFLLRLRAVIGRLFSTKASPMRPMPSPNPQRTALDQLRPSSFAFDAAIFDFDGTLADSCRVWREVDRDFFEARGLTYTPEYGERLAVLGFEDGARFTIEIGRAHV